MSRIAVALAALVAITACSSLPSELEPFDGTFEYVAFDADGAQVLEGELVLDVKDDGTVRGTWKIDWVEGADRNTVVGPQVGEGALEGSVEGGELSANLNPQSSDNNVTLLASLDGSLLVGSWEYTTFSGSTSTGAFTATRR